MRLIPVVTVKDNKPVGFEHGKPVPWDAPYPDGGDDLVGLLRHLFVRFGAVCIEDMGEGTTRQAHHNLYQKLSKQMVEIWVDGHAERLEDLMDHFIAGVETVIVRMHEIDDEELEEALDLVEGDIVLGYAAPNENELIRQLQKHSPAGHLHNGASGVLFVDASGHADGLSPAWIRHGPPGTKVHVRTEVSSPSMVEAFRDAGAATVLLGRSLFEDLDVYAALAKRLHEPGESTAATREEEAKGADVDAEFPAPSTRMLSGILPDKPRIRSTVDRAERSDETDDKGRR